MRYVVLDAFYGDVRDLRRAIDRRLSDRVEPFDPRRFVWEHWHVEGQFSQLRAPARAFFPAEAIAAFEARLLRWAASTYGLSRLGGPPWVSSVTDGGYQGLHRDGPNGTIAFTFALGRGRFRGGETLIARDELLDYFGTGSHRPEVAHTPLFDEIAPRFNRLVAFDARIPHAVRMVEGPRHPRDGRIAIQGWLEPAGCVVVGALDPVEATRAQASSEGPFLFGAFSIADAMYAPVDRRGKGDRPLVHEILRKGF